MRAVFKRLHHAVITFDSEAQAIVRFVGQASSGSRSVLDVGCGYGKNFRLLRDRGMDVTGIDVNPEVVRANRDAGLRCLSVEEFRQTRETYDVLLMSHVIEHFTPQDLIEFMDSYLDRLKVGGRLVIATPLLTRFFYEDFDHVKPYHPAGLLMVFGAHRAQVQYYARNPLRLEDLWIRRGHWRFFHRRARYFRSPATRLLQLLEFASAVLFRLSGGFIGQANGWVGAFCKMAGSADAGQGANRSPSANS